MPVVSHVFVPLNPEVHQLLVYEFRRRYRCRAQLAKALYKFAVAFVESNHENVVAVSVK